MKWLLGIIIFLIIVVFFLKNRELFKPMNVFKVDDKKLDIIVPKFPINDSINIDISNFIEQNKNTFDLKDSLASLTQQKIGDKKFKVFKDSIEKIFVDNDLKNIIFNVNVYDTYNFFAYKIKVHISSDVKIDKNCNQKCNVKINSEEEKKIDLVKYVPVEEPSVPIYFRILNTLYLLDPFKTSSIL